MRNEIHTIDYKGVEFDIIGEYDPGEREVLYYSDGSGCPEVPPSFIIEKVIYKGIDLTELISELIGSDFFDVAEDECLRIRSEYNGDY